MSDDRISRESMSERVAARLRDEILSGTLAPGQRLIVRELVERLGVSHIPIREALRELAAESLVEYRPSQSVVVAGVDINELHDLYRVRRLLELDAAERAFPAYTSEYLAHVREALARLIALTPEHEDGAWWEAHQRYHFAFLEPGLSPWSMRLLRLVWQSCWRYQRLFTLVFASAHDANHEHRRILEAAEGDDMQAFLDAWVRHLEQIEDTITRGYQAHREARAPARPAS